MKKIYLVLIAIYLLLLLIGAFTRVKAQEWVTAEQIGGSVQ
jgi:hypothetical protein